MFTQVMLVYSGKLGLLRIGWYTQIRYVYSGVGMFTQEMLVYSGKVSGIYVSQVYLYIRTVCIYVLVK